MADAPDDRPDIRTQFLGGMSHAACTVNVVTTDGPAGRTGVTVSAMSSVSADTPQPTLLVCVHEMSPAADMILENGVFCVNVLRDDQSYISDTFAGRFKDQVSDKFDCAEWTTQVTGAPRVIDPLVAFDCRVVSSDKVGTHHVIFGAVEDIFTNDRGSPLIYANRAYGSTSRIEATGTIGAGKTRAHQKLSIGCFHTFGPYLLPELIENLARRRGTVDLNLVEGDQRRVQESLLAGETDIALLYELDLSPDLDIVLLDEVTPYILIAENHPLADLTAIAPTDLADYPMVLLNAPPSPDYFLNVMRQAGLEPNIAYRSSSIEMVRGFVGHGLGYSMLATKPATSMSYDGRALTTRPMSVDLETSRLVCATRRTSELPPLAAEFRRLCLEVFDVAA
ncbi:MAG: LysR substrate-binding domain-containing protein [Pseudomonadota bacterium]